jgi:hypothetical protein
MFPEGRIPRKQKKANVEALQHTIESKMITKSSEGACIAQY